MRKRWNYNILIGLAKTIENTIADMSAESDLLPAHKTVVALAENDEFLRAWLEVAPAAAARKFGDCKPVNELRALAEADMLKLFEFDSAAAANFI